MEQDFKDSRESLTDELIRALRHPEIVPWNTEELQLVAAKAIASDEFLSPDARTSLAITETKTRGRGGYSRSLMPRWVGYTIIAVACVVLISIVKLQYTPSIKPRSALSEARTYTTSNGQRANITLPDGSLVTLAPATTVRVSGSTGRDVYLEGEAVFTVLHKNSGAFTVYAGKKAIRVLGTTFGVRAYDELRVAVAKGRVSVGTFILSAGDVATIRGNSAVITQNEDVVSLLAWTNGELTFRDIPLGGAVRDIERWFGVKLRIADSQLASYPISATLGGNTPAQLAEILSRGLNAQAELRGNEIVISKDN